MRLLILMSADAKAAILKEALGSQPNDNLILLCRMPELDGSGSIGIAFWVGGLATTEGPGGSHAHARATGPISLWSRTKFRMRLPTPRRGGWPR